MKKQGLGGEVLVEFIVDPNGGVNQAHAERSTRQEFENSAVLSVSKWRFKPGRKNGVAVNTLMHVPIIFTLTNE